MGFVGKATIKVIKKKKPYQSLWNPYFGSKEGIQELVCKQETTFVQERFKVIYKTQPLLESTKLLTLTSTPKVVPVLCHTMLPASNRSVLRLHSNSSNLSMKERNQSPRKRHLRLLAFCSFSLLALLLYLLRTPVLHSTTSSNTQLNTFPLRVDWLKHPQPNFCDSLKSFPQPNDPQCTKRKGNTTCDPEKPQFFSQDGEDYYLYTRHFSPLNRPGVYIDIAANDATEISNTYFMDRCLGWRGVCAEANAKYFEKLFRERSCLLVPTCVSDPDGNVVRFGMRSASGGIVDTYKGDAAILESGSVERLRCTSLKSVFERTGLKEIDYLSLDVEGHELMVLEGIDWDSVRINIITVELSSQNRQQIVTFLADRGFQRIDTGVHEVNGMKGFHMNDPIFVHQSQVFGKPT